MDATAPTVIANQDRHHCRTSGDDEDEAERGWQNSSTEILAVKVPGMVPAVSWPSISVG